MSNSGTQILQYAAQAGDSGQQLFSVQGGQMVIQGKNWTEPFTLVGIGLCGYV